MSEERPTDKQFVSWWIYTALSMRWPMLPEDNEELQNDIRYGFGIVLSNKRCQRLSDFIKIEVEKLKSQYIDKVQEIADI